MPNKNKFLGNNLIINQLRKSILLAFSTKESGYLLNSRELVTVAVGKSFGIGISTFPVAAH